jgi:hypothetical protein
LLLFFCPILIVLLKLNGLIFVPFGAHSQTAIYREFAVNYGSGVRLGISFITACHAKSAKAAKLGNILAWISLEC